MAKLPRLLSGREIKEMMAATRQTHEGIGEAIRRLDVAIDALPPGQDRRSLRATQDELKQQSGLFPEHEPRRIPRADWTSEQLMLKAVGLKDAARKWTAAGRLDKAKKCLEEASSVERDAGLRRTTERKQT
jgi:type IV secretory pathway VirD2 relaxase